MTEGQQPLVQETRAAKQNFTGSEIGSINMKGIWQELWQTDSTLADFFPGFPQSDNSNNTGE